MKKTHILKKKEARFWKKIGPVTEENMDTYPIGNPFKKTTKKELTEMGDWIKKYREENPLSAEDKERIKQMREKFIKEDKETNERMERQRIRKIFIK